MIKLFVHQKKDQNLVIEILFSDFKKTEFGIGNGKFMAAM